ncbi:unnamed protein product [Ectocarpus fasciculatus]
MKRLCQTISASLLVALRASAYCTCRTLPSSGVGSSRSQQQQCSPPIAKTELRAGRSNPPFGRSKQGETAGGGGESSPHHKNMGENPHVRPIRKQDLPALKSIIDGSDLFPSEMLDDMTDGFLNKDAEEVWLARLGGDGTPAGLVYAKPEMMTEGTWNALLLAVRPDVQRSGFGRELMASLESMLKGRGHRLLVVETAGSEDYAGARSFYESVGFEEEGRIRDFYQPGEDKVIYRKQLL